MRSTSAPRATPRIPCCGSSSPASPRWRRSTWTPCRKRYHAELPTAAEDFQLDRAAIFAGVDRKPEDPANLFRIAIAFEQRAVEFFTREGARAPAGSVESELYKELAAEEREHVALLTTEYRRWETGKAGIL